VYMIARIPCYLISKKEAGYIFRHVFMEINQKMYPAPFTTSLDVILRAMGLQLNIQPRPPGKARDQRKAGGTATLHKR
jgi:hypothetical protein